MNTSKKVMRMLTGGLVACALGAIAWARPPLGLLGTNIVGPVLLDEINTKAETDTWQIELKTKGLSDVYMTEIKIAPGGHGGWHSHPGPSFICVKSGTAGSGFVEDAHCVHFLANEGNEELVVIVMQIVEFGAPRRIDELAP